MIFLEKYNSEENLKMKIVLNEKMKVLNDIIKQKFIEN